MATLRKLNFFPYYEELLRSREKNTTIRLGKATDRFQIGDNVKITVGWNERDGVPICNAVITDVIVKKVGELTGNDLRGESPDCLNTSAVKYVLSSIYRKVVGLDDHVTIIKWRYEE